MATRFGAASPAQAYQTKMRWMIGGLVTAIVVLVGSLVWIVKSGDEQPAQPDIPVAVTPAAEPSTPTVDVLYAVQRIEEGSQLEPRMFESQPVPADRVPEGAWKAQDKQEVVGKFAKTMINANLPLVVDYVSTTRPISALHIPPGFRAVTITIDAVSGVEGYAKPNSRVDVLWTYTDRKGQKSVATIVRFVKVLSVGGLTTSENGKAQVGGTTTVTLLVSERDAKKIELARTSGSLRLTLVGGEEPQLATEDPDPVNFDAIIGAEPQVEVQEEKNDGVMYTADPKTGRQIRYVLRHGKWVRDDQE